jgi:ribosomal protein S18 acetylase RimI-like enzyme
MRNKNNPLVYDNLLAYYKGIAVSLGGQFYEGGAITWFTTGRRSLMGFNAVLSAKVSAENLVEVVSPVIDHFLSNNRPFFWADFPPGETPGLGEFLTANGIPLMVKGMPAMARSLDDVPPLPSLEMVVIDEVHLSRDETEWMDVHMNGFGDPIEAKPDFKDYLEYSLTRPEWRHFIARRDGVPCAISSLLCAREAAGIYHVTTLPAYRGCGLGKALTLAAMQAGREHGYTTAVLFATPDGSPLYQKLGFETVVTADIYACSGENIDHNRLRRYSILSLELIG